MANRGTKSGKSYGKSDRESQNFNVMAKYSEKTQELVEKTMKKMKDGKLKSSSGDKVTDRDQALAIALSEAREKGYKVPPEKD